MTTYNVTNEDDLKWAMKTGDDVMRLYNKVMLLNIVIVIFAMISFVPYATLTITNNLHEKVEINIMNTANMVSKSTAIRQALESGDPQGWIAEEVRGIQENVTEIQFIVVADMNSVRYSHPDTEKIGKRFVGGDETRVIETGEIYISEGVGTLGESLRAFVPVYNVTGDRQIGFVSVGTLTRSIGIAQREAMANIFLVTLFALAVGSVGAVLLTNNIKQMLFGLEPEKISELYHEKDSMLKAIHEGIVAIDQEGNINMINNSAMDILGLSDSGGIDAFLGQPIAKVFENTKLPQILLSGESEYDDELTVSNTVIVANRVPILSGDKTIGALATFKDKTQVTRLAEEVTGVNQIVAALRANTHEFMNKLHVILGLVQMEKYDEARAFILSVSQNQEVILNKIIKGIEDSTIAALLIGKNSRSKELGVNFKISDNSHLGTNEEHLISSQVLVTVLGNLLENAFEAVDKSRGAEKEVTLAINDDGNEVIIQVSDTGVGIPEQDLSDIYERGFTTKEGSEGVGLNLVERRVESCKGTIDVISEVDKGTMFTVRIPKGIKEELH